MEPPASRFGWRPEPPRSRGWRPEPERQFGWRPEPASAPAPIPAPAAVVAMRSALERRRRRAEAQPSVRNVLPELAPGWLLSPAPAIQPAAAGRIDNLDAWLASPGHQSPADMAAEAESVIDARARFRRRGERLKRSAMIATAVATLATGALFGQGLGTHASAAAVGGGQQVTYTVQPGDTLNKIAARYGVSTRALIQTNPMPNPDLIYPGQVVVIPAVGAGGAGGYKVQPGDTLNKIAQRYGVPMQTLAATNRIANPDRLYAGQLLAIPGQPGGGSQPAAAAKPAAPAPAQQTQAPAVTGMIWPTQGKITQAFGPTRFGMEPAYQGYAHFHQGLDIANVQGTPVKAAAAGKVIAAGWNGYGYGNYVEIDHGNGLHTLYGHMAQAPAVSVGQSVSQGQYLGPMGSTGNSTGSHLHFGVMKDGVWVDAKSFLP